MGKMKKQNMSQVGLILLCLSLIASVTACGGEKKPKAAKDGSQSVESSGPNTLQSIHIQSEPLGTVVTFVGTKEMSPNIFKLDDPARIVVDLTETKLGDIRSEFNVGDSTVSRISVEQFNDGPTALSRAEISLNIPSEYRIQSVGNKMALIVGDVVDPIALRSDDVLGETLPSEQEVDIEGLGQMFSVEEDPVGDPFALVDSSNFGETPSVAMTSNATSLQTIDYATSEEGTVVMITGDGVFSQVQEQTLSSPNRLVFDFQGVTDSQIAQKEITMQTQEVSKVRIGKNDGYTRVVLDLGTNEIPEYTLSKNQDKVTILVSKASPAWAPSTTAAAPVQESFSNTRFEDPTTVNVDLAGLDVDNKRRVTIERVEFQQMDSTNKSRLTIALSRDDAKFDVFQVTQNQLRVFVPNARFKNSILERHLDTSEYQSVVTKVTPSYQSSDKSVSFLVDMNAPNVSYDLQQVGNMIYVDFPIPPKSQVQQTASATSTSSMGQSFEAPQVANMIEQPRPAAANKPKLSDAKNYKYVKESFMSDTMEGGEPFSQMGQILSGNIEGKRFTGRKISLDIKDADIRSIFRLIADISKFNLIISDEVQGRVTIKLDDVPWDQAFAIILQSKGLWFEKYGSIVRIAPAQRLQQEKEQAAAAQAAAQAVLPLDILFKPVSYAEASTLTQQVGSVLSPRGSVDIDSRTNTLIIKDIRENLDKAKKMVDILDTQTPQVSIEARIVEATENFGRSLGINWSGNTRFTPATGNPTGLWFPNSINVPFALDFGSVQTGIHTAGVQLGSINNVLDLDLQLAFGEQRGESKLVSAPKVTVLDNRSATISAGSRIPFVTQTADSGSNVRFENAATTLTVTPHITNEGAIMMQITASRNEPNFAALVQGNPSIDQRTATTEVLVKSGNTTVLGGIYAIRTGQTKQRIPFVSSLPIIGAIFQNYDRSLNRTELLIFVTPRIVGDEREAIRDVRQ